MNPFNQQQAVDYLLDMQDDKKSHSRTKVYSTTTNNFMFNNQQIKQWEKNHQTNDFIRRLSMEQLNIKRKQNNLVNNSIVGFKNQKSSFKQKRKFVLTNIDNQSQALKHVFTRNNKIIQKANVNIPPLPNHNYQISSSQRQRMISSSIKKNHNHYNIVKQKKIIQNVQKQQAQKQIKSPVPFYRTSIIPHLNNGNRKASQIINITSFPSFQPTQKLIYFNNYSNQQENSINISKNIMNSVMQQKDKYELILKKIHLSMNNNRKFEQTNHHNNHGIINNNIRYNSSFHQKPNTFYLQDSPQQIIHQNNKLNNNIGHTNSMIFPKTVKVKKIKINQNQIGMIINGKKQNNQ